MISQPGTISAIPGITLAQLFALGTDSMVRETNGISDTIVPGVEDPSHYTITFTGVAPGQYRLVLRIGPTIVGIEPIVTVTANGWSVGGPGGAVNITVEDRSITLG